MRFWETVRKHRYSMEYMRAQKQLYIAVLSSYIKPTGHEQDLIAYGSSATVASSFANSPGVPSSQNDYSQL